jgi:ribonuclease VapC
VNKFVLDSSALIVLINRETGWENLPPPESWPSNALINAVNAAEVQAKLVSRGVPKDAAWKAIVASVSTVLPFASEEARLCGDLISSTQKLGLSLGDRACLATGFALNLPIYTADRPWSKLELALEIRCIR